MQFPNCCDQFVSILNMKTHISSVHDYENILLAQYVMIEE